MITIVLDCSNSMGPSEDFPRKDYKRETECAYHQATRALRRVLAKIPQGVKVSLWLFGHKYDERTGETPMEQILSPEVWDPAQKAQLQRLMDKLEDQQPSGNTPLVDTMLEALQKDLLRSSGGFRTLLVLTDGQDSKYEKVPNKAASLLQDNFDRHNIFVNVVLFLHNEVVKKERDGARAQLGVIEGFTPAGVLEEASDEAQLAKKLEWLMLPKMKLLKDEKTAPGIPREGLPISFDGTGIALTWSEGLPPGLYDAQVYTSRHSVVLDPGDRLLVNLKAGDEGLVFERTLFADEPVNLERPSHRQGEWLAAVLQNRAFSRPRALELLLTLEKVAGKDPPKDVSLRQPKPGFSWLEVEANGSAGSGLRWGRESGYPAPAFLVNVADWPFQGRDPVPPQLKVWWIADADPPADHSLRLRSGRSHSRYKGPPHSRYKGPRQGA